MESSVVEIASNSLLVIFVIVIIVGIICSKISEMIKIPDVVLFLLCGILMGPSALKFIDMRSYDVAHQVILTFGSAFILYLGGKEVSLKVLKDVKITVVLMATIGVLISTFLMSYVIGLNFEISMTSALLAGAIIASTDPATLVPIFEQVKINKKVKQTVISESAFNDATGAILTAALLTIISSGKFSLGSNLYDLVVMVVVGSLIGLATGILLLKSVSDEPCGIFKDFTPIVSIVSVIVAYELSTFLGGSGYMSCFIVGIVTGNKKNFRAWLSKKSYDADCHVTQTIGTICRMAIFVILGSQVDLVSLTKYFVPSLIAVLVLIFVVRPICVLACTVFDKKAKWSKQEILFMMWVRETGVIPAALCGIVTSLKIPGYEIISSIVFMTILITLIVQGSTTQLVAKKLGLLDEGEKESV